MDTVPVLPGPTPITLSVIRRSSLAPVEEKLYWIPILRSMRAALEALALVPVT